MKIPFFISLIWILSCTSYQPEHPQPSVVFQFSSPKKVSIEGYSGDAMEPFVSRDGKWLFFNNLNDPSVNTDIFYAERINDTVFQYKGPLPGVNSSALDGVATMDSEGNFYFVSPRTYEQTFAVIYQGIFSDSGVNTIHICPGISRNEPGIVNFDVEVSADGNTLYFVDARFNASGQPQSADLEIAAKTATGFQRIAESDQILMNVNTDELEYAAGISADELTLYFTRVPSVTANVAPRIFYATRKNKTEPFNNPIEIKEITGFVEAITTAGDSLLYFHKKVGDRFGVYCLRKSLSR